MVQTVNWVLGPHLLGILFLVIGCIQYYWPPKHINSLYGYRTVSSQKNQQTWDAANRYSAVYMVRCGVILTGIGIVAIIMMIIITMPANIRALVTVMLFMLSGIMPPVLIIVKTEKYLTRRFGNN